MENFSDIHDEADYYPIFKKEEEAEGRRRLDMTEYEEQHHIAWQARNMTQITQAIDNRNWLPLPVRFIFRKIANESNSRKTFGSWYT